MKINIFGRTSAFIAQVAIDQGISFKDAIEIVIQNASRARDLDSPGDHLNGGTK